MAIETQDSDFAKEGWNFCGSSMADGTDSDDGVLNSGQRNHLCRRLSLLDQANRVNGPRPRHYVQRRLLRNTWHRDVVVIRVAMEAVGDKAS